MHKMYEKNSKIQLSKNLTLDEFQCKCVNPDCNYVLTYLKTITDFQALRYDLGRPLTINSAFRCQKHNFAIGGEKNSRHMRGQAIDIAIPNGITVEAFAEIASNYFDKVIKYPTFIHCHNEV